MPDAAVMCKKYAQALYQYCDFFDNHMRNDTDVMNCVKAQDYSGSAYVNFFDSDEDREYMKKFIRVLICLLIVIIAGVGGYFVWQKFSRPSDIIEPSGDVVTVDPGLAAKAIVKTVQIRETASGVNRIIDVKYPSIHSFKNKDFQNYVTNMITNVIFAYKYEIMVMVKKMILYHY